MGRLRSDTLSLCSRDPVSLYNATRYAAFLASKGQGAWGKSNWVEICQPYNTKHLLLHSWDEEKSQLIDLINSEKPNLVLIGTMTICFPGAIECAKLAKKILGKNVTVVLGGKHINETVYINSLNEVSILKNAPINLQKEKVIPDVFDLFVSGEAEHLIVRLGELIMTDSNPENVKKRIADTSISEIDTPGEWIISTIIEDEIVSQVGNTKLKNDEVPSAISVFGTKSDGFDVFPGTVTGQLFSHYSMGCVYKCSFCSESSWHAPLNLIHLL
ncbi:hypothetical protein [Gimesia fumaroli]|uniref:hypothetical protein n=1 Tax=Gimesia fumaroli TaxID=2527976 RepID=UPI0011A6A960|nr:hypothetical protein [Gimesia fumaroli]